MMNNPLTQGCPLLATDRIHTVRQRKTVPDASRPKWVHLFRRHVYLRFNAWCWRVMGIEPPDAPDGSWSEGQQSFTRRADADALMRFKGPGWFVEETPLNGCLPDESCTFGDTEFPLGETFYRNGTNALPMALPSEVATLQNGIAALGRELNRRSSLI